MYIIYVHIYILYIHTCIYIYHRNAHYVFLKVIIHVHVLIFRDMFFISEASPRVIQIASATSPLISPPSKTPTISVISWFRPPHYVQMHLHLSYIYSKAKVLDLFAPTSQTTWGTSIVGTSLALHQNLLGVLNRIDRGPRFRRPRRHHRWQRWHHRLQR